MKLNYLLSVFLIVVLFSTNSTAQRKFSHPGLSYTQSDIDRMKAMIAARQEPFYTTFQALVVSRYSIVGTGIYADTTSIGENGFNRTIGADGRSAHDMALLYKLTDNEMYAKDAVAKINKYRYITNASSRGTAALDNGKIYLLLEAAELLRDYPGWKAEDQAAFKKMLTYPFYSTKVSADSYKSNTDSLNKVSFYWNIYNFDPGRFGNQGLFAARGVMSMGVYLDNDTIYDRVYRYLLDLPHRTDDLPLQAGKPVRTSTASESDYKFDYNVSWDNTVPNYHSDETLKYYIYANGQNQESCRDQSHTMGGIGNYTCLAEIAWNQGDSLYSCLGNRILTGVEYNTRYNLSMMQSYPDQTTAWEPTSFSKNESECTYDNGKFYQALSRSGRWEAKTFSPDGRGTVMDNPGGWRTQILMHYKVRMGMAAESVKWTQRSYDYMMDKYGFENWGLAPNWYYEWNGWGTLTKYITEWMVGDAGTFNNFERVSKMPSAPCEIKAVDYDYFTGNGEGRTYHNMGTNKSTVYRTDGTVEIQKQGNDYAVTNMEDGEWMNYSVVFPAALGNSTANTTQQFNIYATYKSTGSGASLFAAVDNAEKTGKILAPTTEWTEIILGTVTVKCGAAVLRIYVRGTENTVQLKSLRIAPLESYEKLTVKPNTVAQSVKVYDLNNNDVTATYTNSILLATDSSFNATINMATKNFMVYDFGEQGLDVSKIIFYNDGITKDTREFASYLGLTTNGNYTGDWNKDLKTDILRTNGTIQNSISIIENSWLGDGIGKYIVGPLGKIRYLGVYNWSAACRISEIEIECIKKNAGETADTETSAVWIDDHTALKDLKIESGNLPPFTLIANVLTIPEAKWIEVYNVNGSLVSKVNGDKVAIKSQLTIVKFEHNNKIYSQKIFNKN